MRTCEECGASIEGRKATARFCSDRCRKLNNQGGFCEVCGVRTAWHNPPTRRCMKHPYVKWTQEAIIEAIQRFEREVGRPPAATDWNIAQARKHGHKERVERYLAGEWPDQETTRTAFGTWADAIVAAGFPRPHVGRYDRATNDERIGRRAA